LIFISFALNGKRNIFLPYAIGPTYIPAQLILFSFIVGEITKRKERERKAIQSGLIIISTMFFHIATWRLASNFF